MRQAPLTRRRHHHVPAPRLSEAPPARHGSEISTGLPSPRQQRRLSRPAPLPEHAKVDFAYLYSRHQHLLHARRLHRAATALYAQGKHKEAMELNAQALAIAHPPRAYRSVSDQPTTFDKIVSGTVGRHGLLGAGEDLVRSANPVSLVETLSARAQHPLRRGHEGISAGVIMPGGFGRFGGIKAAEDVAPAGADLFGKETVTRPRTRAEAETRLRQLDRQLESLYRRVGKGIGHPLAEPDIAQQIGRSRSLIGKRARGKAVEGRVTGPPVTRPSVKDELRTAAIDTIERFAKRNPAHPVFKAWQAAETEREALMRSLHGHMPGETPSGELGSVTEERFAPGEEVRRSLGAMRTARAEQKKLYRAERGVRVGRGEAAMEEAGGGVAGFKAAMAEQRGALPKVTFDRLREGTLGTADVERLVRHVQAHPELEFWQRQNATRAILDAVEHGRTPTPSEIKLLQTAFGQENAAALSRVSGLKRAGRIVVDVSNIPRTMMASVDLSAPFRQGLVAGARHPHLFVRNFGPMIRSFGSERVYEATIRDIFERPNAPLYEEAGLKITTAGADLGKREEAFISKSAEKIPLIRSSSRAYHAFLDKMRADMFDRQLDLARKQGVNVEDLKQLKSIARLVNNATGRGDLGPVEHWAPAMNAFFFSPRLIASRVNMLNPVWYATLTPFARKQAVISMIRLGSVAAGVLGLGTVLGAKVTGDPRSADFAKLRIGNTRADVLGGFQQYIRVGSQLATKKVISSTTGKTLTLGSGFGDLSRWDIAERFAVGKFAPPPSFVHDFFTGTQFDGQPFSVKKAILQRTIPLVVQDSYDLYHNSDSVPLALLGYSISAFGIGMQTYGAKKPKSGGSRARPRTRSLLGPRTSGGGSSLLRRGGSSGGGQSLLRR